MAICPTPNCGEKLLPNSRRAYCYKCRAYRGRWSKRSAAEIVVYSKKLIRSMFRIEHLPELRIDQAQAVQQRPIMRSKRR